MSTEVAFLPSLTFPAGPSPARPQKEPRPEPILDWDEVEEDLAVAAEDPERVAIEDGERRVEVFIGTVAGLTPSGKYYTAWACSNVTEEEAEEDAAWWEQLEAEAEAHGCYVTQGEGDPCDVFVGRFLGEDDPEEVE